LLPWLEFWTTLTETTQSYGYSFLVYENIGRVKRALDTLGECQDNLQRKVSLPWLEFWRTLTENIQTYGHFFLVYENVGRVTRALDTLGKLN